MKFMKKIIISLLALAGIVTVGQTHASLIQYKISFDGAIAGEAGTGSFFWDETTQLISGISWDFGGQIGGIDDTQVDWSAEIFGGTRSQLLFEILTLQDVSPPDCTSTIGCLASFSSGEMYGFPPSNLMGFSVFGSNIQRYSFIGINPPVAKGYFSTSVVSVFEPSSLLLTSLGLVVFVFAHKKRLNNF